MRNIISLAHISLDGFMADPAGRFDFVAFNDELADHTYPLMGSVDLAVYGRVTYQMMESYWPTAGDAPDASAHAKSHAHWYNAVKKIVASRTLAAPKNPNVRVVGDDIVGALRAEKQKAGGDIMIFAQPDPHARARGCGSGRRVAALVAAGDRRWWAAAVREARAAHAARAALVEDVRLGRHRASLRDEALTACRFKVSERGGARRRPKTRPTAPAAAAAAVAAAGRAAAPASPPAASTACRAAGRAAAPAGRCRAARTPTDRRTGTPAPSPARQRHRRAAGRERRAVRPRIGLVLAFARRHRRRLDVDVGVDDAAALRVGGRLDRRVERHVLRRGPWGARCRSGSSAGRSSAASAASPAPRSAPSHRALSGRASGSRRPRPASRPAPPPWGTWCRRWRSHGFGGSFSSFEPPV